MTERSVYAHSCVCGGAECVAFVAERSGLTHKVAFVAERSVLTTKLRLRRSGVCRAMRKVAFVAKRSVLSHKKVAFVAERSVLRLWRSGVG